ncbi:MAG: glycosyltransferase [Nitrospira sp.]|nr:glycosyltransferase [Nitrospira sp.]MCA9468493.1 glycosyltransferase [Nitrospira sp.]MCB9776695.1 glycosyltransferase [Nitrospiraceae bacterium]
MNYPKISVVIPSYNQGNFIEATLQSVLSQQYPNLELLVIDGGSTDNTLDIIKAHESGLTYWVSEPDHGQTDALIKGFRQAQGDIWCWLNSDDLHTPHTLREVADAFTNFPDMDAIYGNATWINTEGQPLREQREIPFNRFIWLYTHNYIPGMSMFWKRELYELSGGLNPAYDLAMDADLWIRFSHFGQIHHVPSIWSYMRFYPDQKNRRLRTQSDMEDIQIRKRYWGRERPRFYSLKKSIAQTWRVSWKLLTGCYPYGYVRYLERQ